MNLKDGQPKKWGQIYLEKLLNGDDKPTLESWNTFEAAFLRNWSDPAAQIAEHACLEWSDPALIASFQQGLKAEVRSKLIEYTLHKNITTLDEFISTASTAAPAHHSTQLRGAHSFVSKKIQEARRNAGECSKCGEKSHKWEDCKNGWRLKTIERSKPESGKAAEVEELELLPQAGKV
ncbi:Retrotransposon-derived protein PEG10 [Rhizoctonia solani]|uniref:Retrotransposon-derived protein PEG10 n=1 Tax=Rhizoctonia solani TaxID=456999 RepID=A0A8H8T061_9AGAM|nr:Retrotransposon-derived protein PEG10 [Rhizoctonia solani]QRW24114.1 Retrotransposon-derived protein PEG10 [Rhizoctonia solani]